MKKANNLRKMVLLWAVFGVLLPGHLSAVKKTYTVAAVGDCLLSSRISLLTDPQFLKLVEILRSADCSYGNCETTLFHAGEGFPAYKTVDPNVFCEPWGADEFRWLGLDIMSLANNHIMDFSFDGLFSTLQNLDQVGIAYAGAGRDLERASRAGYVDTAAGLVSLVSCASWIPEKDQQAAPLHPHMKGRPGLNPLNADYAIQLDKASYEELKGFMRKVSLALGEKIPENEDPWKESINLGQYKVLQGDKFEEILIANKSDVARILGEIKAARANSRLVIAALHEHGGRASQTLPTRFQEEFARQCIDAGADIFLGTGPHVMWGIEIYKGKPIFYSLGNFFFQELRLIAPEAYLRLGMPANAQNPSAYNAKFGEYFQDAAFWESFLPLITFDQDNRLREIRIYPLQMDQNEPLYQRGIPALAEGSRAKAIIARLAELSKVFKTTIIFQNGMGSVQIPIK